MMTALVDIMMGKASAFRLKNNKRMKGITEVNGSLYHVQVFKRTILSFFDFISN